MSEKKYKCTAKNSDTEPTFCLDTDAEVLVVGRYYKAGRFIPLESILSLTLTGHSLRVWFLGSDLCHDENCDPDSDAAEKLIQDWLQWRADTRARRRRYRR